MILWLFVPNDLVGATHILDFSALVTLEFHPNYAHAQNLFNFSQDAFAGYAITCVSR